MDTTTPTPAASTRDRLLELVRADPHRSIHEYAENLGVTPGRVHQILRDELGYEYRRTWVRSRRGRKSA